MSNDLSNSRPSLAMKTVRPGKPASPLIKVGYIALLICCAATVGKCALDFVKQSGSAQAAAPSAVRSATHDYSDVSRAAEPVLDAAIEKRIEEVLNPSEAEKPKGSVSEPEPKPESAPPAPEPIPQSEPPRPDSVPPVRQQTPLHGQMVTPGNFMYLGAFRPPHVKGQDSNFSFGGWAMAYRADGDVDGPDDGTPGSLFMLGNVQQQLVAEIAIPKPFISKERVLDDLPVAEVLQPLSDVTGGMRSQMMKAGGDTLPFEIGGLYVAGSRLHWTMYKYYNVTTTDYNSHGASSLSLRRPFPEGMWHLGPANTGKSVWHSYKHAGYIFDVPEEPAKRWFGGRRLISGLQIATGLNIASHGPAMYAYNLPPAGTKRGASLNAMPLVYNDLSRPSPGFNPADRWTGGAWLTVGNKHAVVIVGRKALGPVYYGEARPQDCTADKGYHGTPYQTQMLFYAPQALAAAGNGKIHPTTVSPWYVWDQKTPGGGFHEYMFANCAQHTGGVAYDRTRNLLYVAQTNAGTTKGEQYEIIPIIHVFRIVE